MAAAAGRFVVVGGGIAGVTCAEQVRRAQGSPPPARAHGGGPGALPAAPRSSRPPGPAAASRPGRLRALSGARGRHVLPRVLLPELTAFPRRCQMLLLSREETPASVSCALNPEARGDLVAGSTW